MQRRTFLKNAGIVSLGLSSLGFNTIKDWYKSSHELNINDLASLSPQLEDDVDHLLSWMRSNGWATHLEQALGVNLNISRPELFKELIKPLDAAKLDALRRDTWSGQSAYDDFSGERLIQPGFPAHSLLYHALASPRVRPNGVKEYPTLQQLDTLENLIYALADWDDLKAIYGIKSNSELVFAVFAYEYRPAFKTPHHAYADLVYSRTGLGRIGNEPLHYDKVNRAHIAQPADATKEKNVSVIPARYGLFIARKVPVNKLSLVTSKPRKDGCTKDCRDDRDDAKRTFLQPIRKVFSNDELTGSASLRFSESHKSEKLNKFATAKGKGIKMWPENVVPAARLSKELVEQDDALRLAGSSFLVISKRDDLIRLAKENGRTLFFYVPKRVTTPYDTRYFTALCTQEVEDVELVTNGKALGRSYNSIYNNYGAPRNQPLFVNITHEQKGEAFASIERTTGKRFEDKLDKGGYYAPLFEDSICDGQVSVNTSAFNTNRIQGIGACLPAFSVITAPDFFPQIDPLDLAAFDIAPGSANNESHFYEGGVASLATARIRPNPKMIEAKTDNTRDTYLAVISAPVKEKTSIDSKNMRMYKDPSSDGGYTISSFLPDVASSIFAPGWDVTYCSPENDKKNIYIGTEGLGSPFIEDMKFCSALNGMWPATSPDAARTFQGANEPEYRNPTAVPLLDHEIGLCGTGPAGKENENWGWDGEQGPYLEQLLGQWTVNFTDLGRADAVDNALQGKLDMSQLRKLKSNELIRRMDCLKRCIATIPQKNFRPKEYTRRIAAFTYLWLVGAEKVNWGKESPAALNIPGNLVGNDKSWITDLANAKVSGEGYLYVFADSAPDIEEAPKEWMCDLKRRRLNCERIYICQVTANQIAWGEVKNGSISWQVK